MSDSPKPPLFTETVRREFFERRVLVLDGPLDDDNGTLLATQLIALATEDARQSRRLDWSGGQNELGLGARELCGGVLPHCDQTLGDLARQVDQGDVQGTRHSRDHLTRRFLATPLDLGQVLRGNPGTRRGLAQSLATLVPKPPQLVTDHVPPQRLTGLPPVGTRSAVPISFQEAALGCSD